MTTKPTNTKQTRKAKPATAAPGPANAEVKTNKLDTIIAMLNRAKGATLAELVDATGWQAHSVRGALAGGIAKKLGAKVISEKLNGVRRYRAPSVEPKG